MSGLPKASGSIPQIPPTPLGVGLPQLNAVRNFASALDRCPTSAFAVAVVIIAAIKTGVFFHPLMQPEEIPPDTGLLFLNEGVGPNLMLSIVNVAGLRTYSAYELFSFAVMVMSFLAIGFLVLRHSSSARVKKLLLVVLFLGPVGAMLLRHFGANDVWFLVGACAMGLFPRRLVVILPAGALMTLANPGQAFFTAVFLGCLLFLPELLCYMRACLVLVVCSVSGLAATFVLGSQTGGPTQVTWFFSRLQQSLELNAPVVPILVYSGYGITLVVILWVIAQLRGLQLAVSLSSAFLGPILLTLTHLDGTRILVNLTVLLSVVFVVQFGPMVMQENKLLGIQLAVVVLLALALPTFDVFGGAVVAPYEYVIERATFYARALNA